MNADYLICMSVSILMRRTTSRSRQNGLLNCSGLLPARGTCLGGAGSEREGLSRTLPGFLCLGNNPPRHDSGNNQHQVDCYVTLVAIS